MYETLQHTATRTWHRHCACNPCMKHHNDTLHIQRIYFIFSSNTECSRVYYIHPIDCIFGFNIRMYWLNILGFPPSNLSNADTQHWARLLVLTCESALDVRILNEFVGIFFFHLQIFLTQIRNTERGSLCSSAERIGCVHIELCGHFVTHIYESSLVYISLDSYIQNRLIF